MYIPAHKLNLVLVKSYTVSRDIKMILNVLNKLYSTFAEPSNPHRFLLMRRALALKLKEIAQSSETCRACICWCLYAVKSQRAAIRCRLNEVSRGREVVSASGSKLVVSAHDLPVLHTCLIILDNILQVVHVTRKRLQAKYDTCRCSIKEPERTSPAAQTGRGHMGWCVEPIKTLFMRMLLACRYSVE